LLSNAGCTKNKFFCYVQARKLRIFALFLHSHSILLCKISLHLSVETIRVSANVHFEAAGINFLAAFYCALERDKGTHYGID